MIVLLVSVVIGAAITDKTVAVAQNITGVNSPSNISLSVSRDVASTFSTFTGFLPIAVMGMVGAVR